MNIIQVLLGYIPEAVYFALFMIYSKRLNEKRSLFMGLMILEYLLLKLVFRFNIYFQLSYTITTFLTLKLLYKEKSQIIDIFMFTIASGMVVLTSIIVYFTINLFTTTTLIGNIIQKLILFITLFATHNKLSKIQDVYRKLWNRNKKPKKIKSATFRALNVVLFNFLFAIIAAGMLVVTVLGGE